MSLKIVEMTGGLGNQMFQYAFGKYLERRYPEDIIKYDTSYYLAKNAIRKFMLHEAFGVSAPMAGKVEIRAVRGFYPYDTFIDKLIYKSLGRKGAPTITVTEDLDRAFDEDLVSSNGDAYYSGYWQSEEYFKEFRDDIVRWFSIDEKIFSDQAKALSDEMASAESVAIHVRLEDYLEESNYRVYGGICTADYYSKAIEYIKRNCNACKFYLFTTDMSKALDLLPKGHDYIQVEYDNQKDYIDMYLMTKCKHNIIANSTFSWWGAWLNQNENKIVICPDRWFNNHSVNNQLCSDWIKV